MNLIPRPLCIDRLELSYRFGANNLVAQGIVNDTMKMLVRVREARKLEPRRYPNCREPCERIAISLSRLPKRTLVVETGKPFKNGSTWPYAKFEFNVQGLSRNDLARSSFHRAMNDLLPGGGYGELCEDGYVLYAEFAADFAGLNVAEFDAYSTQMKAGAWIKSPITRWLETINMNDGRSTRELAFTVYQKSLQERVVLHHWRRVLMLRIEAKRRFNHTKKHKHIRLAELPNIDNPFEGLGIYQRARFTNIFTSIRDQKFLDEIGHYGLQDTLSRTRGVDRARRERKLAACNEEWWNPAETWLGIDNAVLQAMNL
ncbi:MAG: hypothetical protein IPO13_11225 [Rhodocyclaceae bacterium]|nr:hypothetical protein [Rhodocyclaceae bacterium]